MPARPRKVREQQQTAFLRAYTDSLNVSRAARIAGVNRGTVYRWRAADAVFSAAFDGAIAARVRQSSEQARVWERERQAKRDERRAEWLPAAQGRAAYARECLAQKRRR